MIGMLIPLILVDIVAFSITLVTLTLLYTSVFGEVKSVKSSPDLDLKV